MGKPPRVAGELTLQRGCRGLLSRGRDRGNLAAAAADLHDRQVYLFADERLKLIADIAQPRNDLVAL